MSFKDTLKAHAKAHKITPGQQVNLLIYYLGLRMLFPEITFAQYLERTLLVAGATDENRQFPKDALDHHCPSKGSAWSPDERVDMMLTYLELCQILAAEGGSLPFDAFLATEAPYYKANPPAPPPPAPAAASGTASPRRQTRRREEDAGISAAALAEGTRWNYRVPNGPVLPVTIILAGDNEWALRSDSGEEFTTTDISLFEPFQAETPVPVPTAPSYQQTLALPKPKAEEIENLLVLVAPIVTQPIGELLTSVTVQFSETDAARFDVLNAQPKPYVDAYFLRNSAAIVSLPPREVSIYGQYDFPVEDRVYTVVITKAP